MCWCKKEPLKDYKIKIFLNKEGEEGGWLVGFLTSSSTTRLYRGRAPRQSVWQFYVLPHMRQSWETRTSISAGHIILTPTQPVGSGGPQRGSNPGPPDQESRALPTELPRPPRKGETKKVFFFFLLHQPLDMPSMWGPYMIIPWSECCEQGIFIFVIKTVRRW